MREKKEKSFADIDFLEIKSKAKINLSLDVIEKRLDGYHNISTIMQTITLCDKIVIRKICKEIEVVCNLNNPSLGHVPSGGKNIAYKAAELFKDRYHIPWGVRIEIEKNIPAAAGLAGGSSNAAAVLIGMNKIFNCGASVSDLISIGGCIGADVPFCIMGGTVLGEGIGDILTKLRSLPKTYVLLIVPNIEISTQWVYENFNLDKKNERPKIEFLLEAIKKGEVDTLARHMKNMLESVVIPKCPEINVVKEKLMDLGALGSIMSGSGPSVFGLFKDKAGACKAKNELMQTGWNIFLTETT